jgi:membrane protein implicated in regulation of membrane protease activity
MRLIDRDGRPSALIWLIALVGIALPIAGGAAALYGTYAIFKSLRGGWVWLALGLGLLIIDLVIDQKWSLWAPSSEPELNRRADQLIGQVVTVVDPIEGGCRGSVRAADSVWPAEGTDAACGAKVRVSGCKGTVLTVEPA